MPGASFLLSSSCCSAWRLRGAFAGQTDLALLRGDALSSLLYFANWHFVFAHQGTSPESAAPSPLLHLWSLGVEEQYYLVWPPVALFAFGRGGLKALASVAGIGAMASAILMLSMEAAGFSVDRLYYGTDTRAQALLVGSFLGAIASHDDWRVLRGSSTGTSAGRRTGRSLGWVGAAGLLWAWHALDGQDGFLYRGGFFLVALATASVIATVTTWPHSGLAQVVLATAPRLRGTDLLRAVPVPLAHLPRPRPRPYRAFRSVPTRRPAGRHVRPRSDLLRSGRGADPAKHGVHPVARPGPCRGRRRRRCRGARGRHHRSPPRR